MIDDQLIGRGYEMRKRFLIVCTTLMSAVVLCAQTKTAGPPPAAQRAPTATVATSAATERALLDQYCVTCHNDKTKKTNLTLEKLDLTTAGEHPELWEKVVRKLRAGVMPPPGM